MSEEKENRALTEIRGLLQAGRPLIYVRSPEEKRVEALLNEAVQKILASPVPLFTWTATEGMRDANGESHGSDVTPGEALDFIADYDGPAFFLLKDFHAPMRESAMNRRRLRDLYGACMDTGKFVFLSTALQEIPEEMSRDLALIQLQPPDVVELVEVIDREAEALAVSGVSVDSDPLTRRQLARSLVGLTLDESRHALRRAAAVSKTINAASIPHLLEEKHIIVKKTGVIEHVQNTVGLDDLGGVSHLKKWLLERRKLFQMRDDITQDIVPKGLLVMGISGCGKSLAVKAVASCFEVPLYRLDMVEVFSGRHGAPETAFADACRTLEAMAPAVMWLDEIEMGVSARTDDAAGMLGRIFAFFLTWMQEKTRGLFVAATANRIDLLPAEMIRKGRFDEVFFVDLPTEDERTEIFKIHLGKRGVDPESMQLNRLHQFTKGWTGAEVEQCVVSSLTTAKLAERELIADDLLNMTAKIVPLSRTMKEQVEQIRAWALDRAVRAAPRGGERG